MWLQLNEKLIYELFWIYQGQDYTLLDSESRNLKEINEEQKFL